MDRFPNLPESGTALRTPIDQLIEWSQTFPQVIYLNQLVARQLFTWTWSQALDDARRMASALRARNLPPGSRIAILSKNCAHWFLADFAIMLSGHISVPLFHNQSADSLRYVLEHSGSSLLFVGKLDEPAKVELALPADLPRISFPYPDALALRGEHWDELIVGHAPLALDVLPRLDDTATIIYTSGTTGNPKGAIHRFRQLAWAASQYRQVLQIEPEDSFLSYLPLSHVTERFLIEMTSIYSRTPVHFVDSVASFADDIQQVQPTVFFSVPRLWARFQIAILAKIPQNRLSLLLSLPLIADLTKRKLRRGLGLSHARVVGSGSAPISPSLLEWYKKLDIGIQEGYSMTETFGYGTGYGTGYITSAPPEGIRIGYVGKPMPGLEMKIDSDGEILLRTPSLMDGYYKDAEKTAEVMTRDGYYRTGDMGEITPDGYLKITGRVREQFKTAKGKFVSPAPIEKKLLANPYIEHVCVMGSGMPKTAAVIDLSEHGLQQPHETIDHSIVKTVVAVNLTLEKHEQIGRVIIVSDAWSIENNFLTPTLKMKRRTVEQRYVALAERAFQQLNLVMWEQRPAIKQVEGYAGA